MAPIDVLVNKLRSKIDQHNRMYQGEQIKWDLRGRGDILKDLIKHEFSIPAKYIKRKNHQSSKYLSNDEVKYLERILTVLAAEAISEGINIYPTSPMRSFSRSRTISPVAVVPYRERIARHTRRARTRSRSGRSRSSSTRASGTRASGTRASGTRNVTPPNVIPPRMRTNALPNNNETERLRRMLMGE